MVDRINDRLVQYKKSYKDFVSALRGINVMQLNEPYRSHFQTLIKDLAVHEIVIDAMLGVEQPQPYMFMTLQPQSVNERANEDLGVRVPVPASLTPFNVSGDYEEDRDE